MKGGVRAADKAKKGGKLAEKFISFNVLKQQGFLTIYNYNI